MIALILLHLIITVSCLLTGFIISSCITSLPEENNIVYKPAVIYLINGLIAITGAAQLIAVFYPLTDFVKLFLLAIIICLTWYHRRKVAGYSRYLAGKIKQLNVYLSAALLSGWWMIVVLSSGPTLMDDTESYHIQMIKWLQEYGTVPGLANLHERFGLNSSWFSAISIFIPVHAQLNYFTVLNGLISVWLLFYLCIGCWKNPINDKSNSTTSPLAILFIFILSLIFWPMIRGNATNANYDFIACFILVILFLELWKTGISNNQWQVYLPELIIWPVFLFTVRIINYPLLLISLFGCTFLFRKKKVRLLACLTVFSFILAAAFITRNTILSGYPFYPVYQLDIFKPDWKADLQSTKHLVDYIKYYNRVGTAFLPLEKTAQLQGLTWIPTWFRYLFPYDKFLFTAGIAGFFSSLLLSRRVSSFSLPVKYVIFVVVLQLVSWFLVAPDPRFVYGPLLIGAFLLIISISTNRYMVFFNRQAPVILSFFSLALFAYTAAKPVRDSRYRNLFLPFRLPSPPLETTHLNKIVLYTPEKIAGNWNARCFATDLPCLYEIKAGLRARGSRIQDGFKIKK